MQQNAGATPSKWPLSNPALPNSKLSQESPKSLQGKRRRLAIKAVVHNQLVPMVAEYIDGTIVWDGLSVSNVDGVIVDCTPDMLQAMHLLLRRFDYCMYGNRLVVLKLAPGSRTLAQFLRTQAKRLRRRER